VSGWTSSTTEAGAQVRHGDGASLPQIIPVLYEELRRLARQHLSRQRRGHTLQTSDLVNEAYLRLVKLQQAEWSSRAQFFALASSAMRCVLVDYARRRRCAKRGSEPRQILNAEAILVCEQKSEEIIALDEALSRLAALDRKKAQIVELRYFGGLTVDETAEVVGVAPISVKREWARARAWLLRELEPRKAG